VDEELCKEFKIYNINTIIVAEKLTHLDFDIRKEYANVFQELQGLPPHYPYLKTDAFRIYLTLGLRLLF
jgi:hypothetical protein